MIERKKGILLVLGFIAVALLSVWGAWGGGTAAETVPEKTGATKFVSEEKKESVSKEKTKSVSENESDALPVLPAEESVRQYATGRHKRNRPLTDPFRASGQIAPVPQTGISGAAVSSLPSLAGIVTAGEDRRCILQTSGSAQTLREGEGIAGWTVTEIGETHVVLAGPSGVHSLTL